MDDLRLNPIAPAPQVPLPSFEEVLQGTGVNSDDAQGGHAGWIKAPNGKKKILKPKDQSNTREEPEDRYENPEQEQSDASYKTDLRQDRRKAGNQLRLTNEDGHSEAILDQDEWQAFHTHQLKLEILTPGQLPGPNSLWLNQYMDHVAHERGTAALVRVSDSNIEIEIYHGDSKQRAEALRELLNEPVIIKADWDSDQARAELHGILKKLYIAVDTWSLYGGHLDELFPMMHEWSPARTMLTGADQDAALYCYRQIKTLVLDAEELGRPEPYFQVMFLGCAVKEANEAATRLNRAASTFLDTPMEWSGYRQRMLPLRRTQILSAESQPHELTNLLTEFLEEATQTADLEDAFAMATAETTVLEQQVITEEKSAPEVNYKPASPLMNSAEHDSDDSGLNLPASPEIVIPSSQGASLSPTKSGSKISRQSKPNAVQESADPGAHLPEMMGVDLDSIEESLNAEPYEAPDFRDHTSGSRPKRSNISNNASSFEAAQPPVLDSEPLQAQPAKTAQTNPRAENSAMHHHMDHPQQASPGESALLNEPGGPSPETFSTQKNIPTKPDPLPNSIDNTSKGPNPSALHLAFPEARALDLTIPRQPWVQCIEHQGCLRLALYADEVQVGASQATQALLSASIWARDQSTLIQNACPTVSIAPLEQLKMDLFLAQPAEAMRWLGLMQQHGHHLHLHFLKAWSSPVDSQAFWIYEALS